MKVMVVDDEQDVQILFEQKFRRERRKGAVEFVFAFTAQDAIERLVAEGAEYYALILSDINMPGTSGLELLQDIREKFPDVKVYMITAYDDDENYQKAMSYGASDYLTKPIDFQELKKRIFDLK